MSHVHCQQHLGQTAGQLYPDGFPTCWHCSCWRLCCSRVTVNALPCLTQCEDLKKVLTLQHLMNLCLQARGKITSILLHCMDMLFRWDDAHSKAMVSTGQSVSGRCCFTRQLNTLR